MTPTDLFHLLRHIQIYSRILFHQNGVVNVNFSLNAMTFDHWSRNAHARFYELLEYK